jgi:hypothetical protein
MKLHSPGVRGAYVDPAVVELQDSVLLVLGNDGFRWPDTDGRGRFAGVVWDLSSGDWEEVILPEASGRLEGLAAAPASGGWNVVGGVGVDGPGFRGDSVSGLWHVRVSREGVESLRRISPPSRRLSLRHSALVREVGSDGALLWLIAEGEPFDAQLIRLALGSTGVWEVRDPIDIEFPSYVAAAGPPGDLDLLLVHPRRHVRGDGNSLQHLSQGDLAAAPKTLASSARGAVHRPWIGTAGGRRLISFLRRAPGESSRDLEVGVLHGDQTAENAVRWHTVARGVVSTIPVQVEFASRRWWAVVSDSDGRVQLLAFWLPDLVEDGSLSVASWPMRGLLPPVQLRSVDDTTLLVVGASVVEDSTRVVSKAEYFRVRCRSRQ